MLEGDYWGVFGHRIPCGYLNKKIYFSTALFVDFKLFTLFINVIVENYFYGRGITWARGISWGVFCAFLEYVCRTFTAGFYLAPPLR